MSLENKLRFAKSPPEVCLVARAATLLFAIPPLLRLMDIERIVQKLTPTPSRPANEALTEERIAYLCHRTISFLRRVSRRPNCLRRSLVLYHCLRVHGVPVVIHFGVKRREKTLAGHCWLTLNGSLYHERPEMVSQFAQMFSLPAPGPGDADPHTPEEPPPDVRGVSFDG